MEHQFWHQKWEKREIGFHESQAHPLLVKHFAKCQFPDQGRILVPLCGKSLDLHWLVAQGMSVIGAELVESAVQEFFAELGVTPEVHHAAHGPIYQWRNVQILVGDIFKLTADDVGHIDGIYDRAALVALPAKMRQNYAQQLTRISGKAPQLIISFDYDQASLDGPPFSVTGTEIESLFGQSYKITGLDSLPLQGGLKGKVPALEQVWLLT